MQKVSPARKLESFRLSIRCVPEPGCSTSGKTQMTPHSIGNRVALGKLLCLSLLVASSLAFATDPTTPVRQYVRNTWDTGANLPTTWVDTILQTEDGFIWVG